MNALIRPKLSRSFARGLNSPTARSRDASSFAAATFVAIHRFFIESAPPNSPDEGWPKMVNSPLSGHPSLVPGIMNRWNGNPSCAGRSASKTCVDALVSRAPRVRNEMKAWMAGTGPAMMNAKLQSVPSICRLRFDRHTYERNASEINYGGQNRMRYW